MQSFYYVKVRGTYKSRDGAVGIATDCEMDDQEVGVSVPVWARIFTLHVIQTGSGAHPASYRMGTGALSPGVKRLVREADHSSPTSA
jgi:hypothetical protein